MLNPLELPLKLLAIPAGLVRSLIEAVAERMAVFNPADAEREVHDVIDLREDARKEASKEPTPEPVIFGVPSPHDRPTRTRRRPV